MITQFKIYENSDIRNDHLLIIGAGEYIKSKLPKEFFITWYYVSPLTPPNNYIEYYKQNPRNILFNFYYKKETSQKTLDKIDKFLKEKNIEYIIDENYTIASIDTINEKKIQLELDFEKIIKFGSLNKEVNKYNL